MWAWEHLPCTRPDGVLPLVENIEEPYAARVGRRLIGNPDHRQAEGYLQTAPSYIATVEALRNINIQGQIAVEHGQSNDYTTVMQQIARNELVRLNYGYVLEFPTTDEAFTYEPIDQVRGSTQRREGHRRGRPSQVCHSQRPQHGPPQFNLNDDVSMEAEDEQLYEPRFGQDGVDEENDIGDITQQDLTQSLILQSPMMTPYVPQFDVFEEGSSSQCPPHVVRADCSPLNQMPNAPFEHPIRSSYYNENEDDIINTSQVVNPTQPEERRVPVQYKRRRPTRNIIRPPCGTE
nr:serine/threonine-protein phosphatase 7 long form homolog [Ipomoea batatas]